VPANGEAADMPPGQLPARTFAPAYYWYPPMIGYQTAAYSSSVPPELMGYKLHTERHIPINTVALKEGAPVKSRDDHDLGKVEQVITAPGSQQATHLVVTEGMLNKTRKVIPLDWVGSIKEDEVLLAVSAEVVERLPEYEH